MGEQILIIADNIPVKTAKIIGEHMSAAYSKLRNVYATAILACDFAGADGQVFSGSEDECAEILALLRRSIAEIDQLLLQMEVGPAKLEEADAGFKGALIDSGWDRFATGFKDSISRSTIGRAFASAIPLITLFAPKEKENVGATESEDGFASDILTDSETDDRSKVKISGSSDKGDVAKSAYDTIVDNRRKDTGRGGEKEEYERYTYSFTESGTVSILGTDFEYEKYTDYTGGSLKSVYGDQFYSVDSELSKECQHIDFETTDGSGLSGDITLNGIKFYGDGELDVAKGNAYIKAGADYSVVSVTVDTESDYGGFSMTGEVGAGAHLDAGIHDGKITVDAGVALGIGGGFSFEIDYEAIWEKTCDFFGF